MHLCMHKIIIIQSYGELLSIAEFIPSSSYWAKEKSELLLLRDVATGPV